jgi:hypothetical protein
MQMDHTHLLTVAIPTHNRAGLLRQTLESLTQVRLPAGFDWELLVVQNNCSDDTPTMLTEFFARLPLRALSDARPGVNNARNTAVEASRGEHIIFTDDDTLVCEEWLSAYATAFTSFPDADVFGGPIVPRFCSPPARWLLEILPEVEGAYGSLERRGCGDALSIGLHPYGANMAFRTRVLHEWPFNPTLGPKGNSRINGSETELILKLLANGHTGRWVESARVEHCIQEKQMTTGFLRWYFTGYGASQAIMEPPEPDTKMLWGRPRWLWKELVTAEIQYHVRRVHASPKEWIRDLKHASIARGQFTKHGKTFA